MNRSLFDYPSNEWGELEMDKKIEILQDLVQDGVNIKKLVFEMMKYCNEHEGKNIASIDVILALSELLENCLQSKE